jgi:hypothetical protein
MVTIDSEWLLLRPSESTLRVRTLEKECGTFITGSNLKFLEIRSCVTTLSANDCVSIGNNVRMMGHYLKTNEGGKCFGVGKKLRFCGF